MVSLYSNFVVALNRLLQEEHVLTTEYLLVYDVLLLSLVARIHPCSSACKR